ncbi:hypothetical protein E2542_SST05095 [Spatholobus suberectus]|nr:hypothetical protein E2542_SST05095 [Spatholobus suberectus]
MRCKKHLPDLTSTIGVCASCLRERLQPLLVAQAQAQADADNHHNRKPKPEPEPNPPPLNFPRSVSPYVTHRKSDCYRRRERMFYGTPQVGAAACEDGATAKRRPGGRFWILSNIFRVRSNRTETPPRESCEEPSSSASPPQPSWFSTILPSRRHTNRRCRHADRGLSENFADEAQDRSDSGCSSESSPRKQVPGAGCESAIAVGSRRREGTREHGVLSESVGSVESEPALVP